MLPIQMPKAVVPQFEELIDGQGKYRKRGDEVTEFRAQGPLLSGTPVNKSDEKQGEVESCVGQLIKEEENTAQGIEDVEDVYPDGLSRTPDMRAERSVAKDEDPSTTYHALLTTLTENKQACSREATGGMTCRRADIDGKPSTPDQVEDPTAEGLKNEAYTKEEQMEPAASMNA